MFNLPRHRRDTDKGMTLIEVLVTIFLLGIVGTIIAGVTISALRVTARTTSGIEGQSQLNDAVARIVRDVAGADPILYTSTANGWATNTPAASELWVQDDHNGICVRTRYYLTTSGGKSQLKADTQNFTTCPDPLKPATGTTHTTTLISSVKTTDDAGHAIPALFTYYNAANTAITPLPLSQAAVAKIARVQINVGSTVQNDANGVRLATSVAPRSMDTPLVTNPAPLPDCIKAALTVGTDGANPASPRISWAATTNADRYTLHRTASTYTYNGVTVNVPAQDWPAVTTAPNTVTDTAMKGYHDGPIQYTLTIDGPGGSVDCGPAVYSASVAANTLTAPTVSTSVTPDTSTSTTSITTPAVNLTWGTVTRATSYSVYRCPINANVFTTTAPACAAIPANKITDTTSTTYTDNTPGFDNAYVYEVTAHSDLYTPTIESASSTGSQALTHPKSLNLTGYASTYNQNTLNWTAGSPITTADGYAVFRRPANSGAAWGNPIWTTTNTLTTTYTDTTAALDSKYEYVVTEFNRGPRGTQYPSISQIYYGEPSNTATILQYPSTPSTWATGTESNNAYNPDGRDTAYWTSVPYATSYRLYTATTPTSGANVINVGNTTAYSDWGQPRGSRNYYEAAACNATGCSQNSTTPTSYGYAAAYQRPADLTPTVGNPYNDGCNDVTDTASDQVYNCSTGQATATWTPNADAGDPYDRFCSAYGNPGGCRYIPSVNYSQQTWNTVYGAPYSPSMTVSQSAWGATDDVGVIACNLGGCSDPNTVPVRAYPGTFAVTGNNSTFEGNHTQWWEGGGYNDWPRQDASIKVNWSDSAGVRSSSPYYFSRTVRANDAKNLTASGYTSISDTDYRNATSGAAYNYVISAYANNGLHRDINYSVQVQPGKSGFIQSTKFCNSATKQVDTKTVATQVQVCTTTSVFDHWQDCSSQHASTNPNPGTCVNVTSYYNKHWMYKNSSGTYVDCYDNAANNNNWQDTDPDGTGHCTNRYDNGNTIHWARRVYVDQTSCHWETQYSTQPVYDNINNWGWKSGFKFRAGAYDNDGGNTYTDRWQTMQYVDRVSGGFGTWEGRADPLWGSNGGSWPSNANKNQWPYSLPAYWESGYVATTNATTGVYATASSWGNNEELISNLADSGGLHMVRGVVNQSGAHATDGGEFIGPYIGDVEYKGDDRIFSCGTGWNPLPDYISRTAHHLSPAYGRPGNSLSDWNQNG